MFVRGGKESYGDQKEISSSPGAPTLPTTQEEGEWESPNLYMDMPVLVIT